MKYLNILLIILPFIFSCSSDTPENDKEKIPPIIDTSIRVGTFNVDVGQTATAEEIALSLKSFYLDILSLEECPILIDKNSGVEEFYSIIGKALGMEYFYIGDISSGNHWIEWGKDKTGKYAVKYFTTIQDWQAYNWLDNFQNSTFNVNVETTIKSGNTFL